MQAHFIGGYNFYQDGGTMLIEAPWSTVGRLASAWYTLSGLVVLVVRIVAYFVARPAMNAATIVAVALMLATLAFQVTMLRRPILLSRDLHVLRVGNKDRPLGEVERFAAPERGTPFLETRMKDGSTRRLVDSLAFLTLDDAQRAADLLNGFFGLPG